MQGEAGRVFYRHARSPAARIERAQAEVGSAGRTGSGQVSLGLATCGAASTLALPRRAFIRCAAFRFGAGAPLDPVAATGAARPVAG